MKEWLLFTKIFADKTPRTVAQHAAELGFDGVDVLVRDGYTVSTQDVAQGLVQAHSVFREYGLSVPLVTTDIASPSDPLVQPVFRTCAELEIPYVRLGWWRYDKSRDHGEQWTAAQRDIELLAKTAAEYGLTVLLQMHGGALHQSPTRIRLLLDGVQAGNVGIYFDPGNMVKQEGFEQWPLAVEMVKDRLKMVGVKNGVWRRVAERPARWQAAWVGLDEGLVPWDEVFSLLRAAGYAGPLSFHSHYEDKSFDEAMEQIAADLVYAKSLLA